MIQLAQNLLSNAIKYGGNQPPRIVVSAERKSCEWVITVTDNGIGVHDMDGEKIFNLFTRTGSRRTPGSGVGLAICRAIVQQHGGGRYGPSRHPVRAAGSVSLCRTSRQETGLFEPVAQTGRIHAHSEGTRAAHRYEALRVNHHPCVPHACTGANRKTCSCAFPDVFPPLLTSFWDGAMPAANMLRQVHRGLPRPMEQIGFVGGHPSPHRPCARLGVPAGCAVYSQP